MKSSIKAVFTALLILSASLSYGQHKKMRHEKKVQKNSEYFEKLKSELELSEDQENQMRAIFEERHEQMKAQKRVNSDGDEVDEATRKQERVEQMERRKQMNEEMDIRIAEVLNEEQMAKYKAISQERELEMKARHQERLMEQEHEHRKMEEGDVHQHEDGTEHKH